MTLQARAAWPLAFRADQPVSMPASGDAINAPLGAGIPRARNRLPPHSVPHQSRPGSITMARFLHSNPRGSMFVRFCRFASKSGFHQIEDQSTRPPFRRSRSNPGSVMTDALHSIRGSSGISCPPHTCIVASCHLLSGGEGVELCHLDRVR